MNEKNYNTVTLSQLFWKALSRWWLIVIFTALGALVMYKYASKNFDADMKAYEADNSAYLAQLKNYQELYDFNTGYRAVSGGSEEEKAKKADEMAEFCKKRISSDLLISVNDALAIREQMRQASELGDKQIIARVNPYSIPTLSMIYTVSPELPEQQGTINTYYQNAHNSQRLWTKLYEALGYEEADYSQFTSCNSFAFINGNQFSLSLYYDNLDALKDVKTKLESILETIHKETVKASGMNHTLVQVEANIFTKGDTNIATTQNTYKQWILDYTNRLNSLKNVFGLAQNAIVSNYYEYMVNKSDGGNGYITVKDLTKPKQDDEAAKQPSDPKKLALIGGAAGFALGLAVLLLIMIFGGRLQKAEELSTLFSLGLIGTLLSDGFILPFEKLVKYLSTRRYGPFNVEKRIKHTAVKLKAVCESRGVTGIVLTGTAIVKGNKKILDSFIDEIEKNGIKVEAYGSILKNSEIFKKAAEIKNIVFVEKEISSAYKDIEREILMAGDCGIDVLGAVCIY